MRTKHEPVACVAVDAEVGIPLPAPPHNIRMLFRRVGFHHHQAVANGQTFFCTRQSGITEDRFWIRWVAFKDGVLLKSDCPTLNDAKNVCRAVALQESGADHGSASARITHEAQR